MDLFNSITTFNFFLVDMNCYESFTEVWKAVVTTIFLELTTVDVIVSS